MNNNQPKNKGKSPPMAFDPVEAALRQVFDDIASEDVPEQFNDLIAKLTKDIPREKDK
ncbi:MAG: NepR family anti-sigma factor [Erythrobacter sp.]